MMSPKIVTVAIEPRDFAMWVAAALAYGEL